MKEKLIQMILETLNPKIVSEIVVGILWELAKISENTLDDTAVKLIADHLGIELDD